MGSEMCIRDSGYADVATTYLPTDSRDFISFVMIFSGENGRVLGSLIDIEEGAFATTLGVADVNGDNYIDLLVGSNRREPVEGRIVGDEGVTVYSGENFSPLYTLSSGGDLSFSSFTVGRGAGDVNQDGYEDILLGAVGSLGSVHLVSGIDGSLIYRIEAYGNYRFIGGSVSSIGDIDGDGSPDFIIGASNEARVVLSNGDWDNDGVNTLSDDFPLDPSRQ